MDDFLHKNGILKMKKSCVALLTIAILSLGGCGGEDNKKDVAGQNNQTETETPITPVTPTPPTEPTTPTTPDTPSDQAGGDTKQPDQKPISSFSEAIDKLVAEGKYPRLNRDSDVAGPDVDGNGVRDDLDAYVASLPDTEDQKRAMLQGFRLLRYEMTSDPSDEKSVEKGILLSSRVVSCLMEQYGPRKEREKLRDIIAFSLNTKGRVYAHNKFDKAKELKVSDLIVEGVCDK